MTFLVTEVFDSLQGEGFWTGVPMTFVRLSGCNGPDLGLGCVRWCDTPASQEAGIGKAMEIGDILSLVHMPRICLTGGEPLLQLDAVARLLPVAGRRGLRVHVETNGILDPRSLIGEDEDGLAWSTVSPKPPGYLVHEGWDGLVDELKFVVDDSLEEDVVEGLAEAHRGALVCVQPCWEQEGVSGNGPSVERAVALVMAHPDWRLSMQTHKYLGIR